jgi:hypothetical protein
MKRDILLKANYRYNFDRDLYFNREAKKAFSLEFVDDNSEEELARRIREDNGGTGWKFYTNSDLSDSVRRELESALG